MWSRPTLTGDVPSSRHGHAALALSEDDELLSFGGMSRYGYKRAVQISHHLPPSRVISLCACRYGYERGVHILQLGVGNAHLYPGITHAAGGS